MSRLATATSLLGITTDGVSKDLLDETTVLVEAVKQAQASGKLSHKNFLGSSNEEYAEVTGWLSTSSNALDATALSKLNSIFATKTYLVNQYFSLADVVVFIALHAQNHIGSLNSLPNLSRWFNHIQHLLASFNVLPAVSIPVAPFSILLPALETASAAPVAAPVAVPVATPIAVATPAATEAKKEEPKKEETKKEDKKVKVSSTPAPAAAATAPAAAGGDDSDPSKLEIRVGLIVKCWDHPDSDKLLCEEIDVGEGSTRTIASGIRAYYTAEEVQGRKVLVVSNLKERAMAGFKSQVRNFFCIFLTRKHTDWFVCV